MDSDAKYMAVFVLLIIFIAFGGVVSCRGCAGDGSWSFGEDPHEIEAIVQNKHVDISGGESSSTHYMVTTDKGTFEIDNGWIMGIWNADELYGQLEQGKAYKLTVRGDTTTAWWTQTYPYIIEVEPVIQE